MVVSRSCTLKDTREAVYGRYDLVADYILYNLRVS